MISIAANECNRDSLLLPSSSLASLLLSVKACLQTRLTLNHSSPRTPRVYLSIRTPLLPRSFFVCNYGCASSFPSLWPSLYNRCMSKHWKKSGCVRGCGRGYKTSVNPRWEAGSLRTIHRRMATSRSACKDILGRSA